MSDNQRDEINNVRHEAVLEKIDDLKNSITSLGDSVVSKERFKPVENITYGLVSIMLIFMIGQILTNTTKGEAVISAIMTALGAA